ncbi:MAG: hypothetical protein JWM20_329 [Patescibacteria group bacterium]|nr:hypothetical protein [Patescibacteria group bacterium]
MGIIHKILRNKFPSKTKEDIEDLVQEGVLRALRWANDKKNLTELVSVKALILRSAFNHATDILRSRIVHDKKSSFIEFEPRSIPDPHDLFIKKERDEFYIKTLAKGMEHLPEDQRRIIDYQMKEMSYREMAVIEETSVNTLLSRGFYARRKLKEVLHPAA